MRLIIPIIASILQIFAPAALAATDWSVRVTPFNQVFPALELSQARRTQPANETDHILGAGSGLISVSVPAHHAGEHVALRIEIPALGPAQNFAATLAESGVTYHLHPPLDWTAAQLRLLPTPLNTHLNIQLTRDGVAAGANVVGISLRPLDEALYFVRDGKDRVDLSWIFAAYVDEHDAIVDRILDSARQSGIIENFDGYAGADPDDVQRQVWAIWQALSERGIRYSGADPAIERGPNVFSQRVRFLADTWADRSANCIDGSVLIASVLQRVGLRAFLVLVPGHAFVGYYTDADARQAAYLETTLLGAHVRTPDQRPAFARTLKLNIAQRASLGGFTAALGAGRARHSRVAAKLDGRHHPDFAVIDIDAARAYGIRAIAAGSAELPASKTRWRSARRIGSQPKPAGATGTALDYPAPNRNVNAAPPSASERDTSRVPR